MLARQQALPAYDVQTAVDTEYALIVAHAVMLDAELPQATLVLIQCERLAKTDLDMWEIRRPRVVGELVSRAERWNLQNVLWLRFALHCAPSFHPNMTGPKTVDRRASGVKFPVWPCQIAPLNMINRRALSRYERRTHL